MCLFPDTGPRSRPGPGRLSRRITLAKANSASPVTYPRCRRRSSRTTREVAIATPPLKDSRSGSIVSPPDGCRSPARAPDSPFSAAPQAPLLVPADARDGAGGKERRWSNPMTARQSRALGGHLWDSRRVQCCCVALRFLRRSQSRIGVDVGRNQFVLFHAQHRAAYRAVGKNQPTSNVMLIAESEFSPV